MKKICRFACYLAASIVLTVGNAPAQSRENRHMRIVNRSSVTLRYLYASNVDSHSWEEDPLGPFQVILPDQYLDANIDDGSGHGLYDPGR